ncbi:mechanosensitive ion channel family protein [Desulfonema magnum]|nr:mechanosensitive ion channel domain-containing protein [Desulfonema magnum]
MFFFKKTNCYFTVFCILVLMLFFTVNKGFSEEEEEVIRKNQAIEDINGNTNLKVSIETTLKTETEHVGKLKKQLSDLRETDRILSTEMNAYKVRLSGYGNILVSPKIQIEDIEKAWADTNAALTSISDTLKYLVQNRDVVRQSLEQAEEQYELNEKQLLDINTDVSDISEIQTLVDNFQSLIKLLSFKIQYLEELHKIYTEKIDQLEDIQKAFTEFSGKFDEQIKLRKKEALFKRKESPLLLQNWKQVREELILLFSQSLLLFSKNFWSDMVRTLWKTSDLLLVTALVLFGIIQIALLRIRRYFIQLGQVRFLPEQYPWRHFILQIFRRSLLLLGTTLFVYFYAHLRNFYSTIPVIRLVFHILLTWLFSQWSLVFLKLWNQRGKYPVPGPLVFRLRILIILIRSFAIVYLVISWLVGESSIILFFVRIPFEISLLVWCILSWKTFRKSMTDPDRSPRLSKMQYFLMELSYLIVGGGIISEFAGYGSLAIYWYTSWACTAVSLLWGGLFFFLLYEWNKRFKTSASTLPETSAKPADPLKWLFLQICWLIWLGIFSISLFFAWGAKQAVIIGFFKLLSKNMTLGGMNLSFLGFVYGIIILLCTHAATRVWKNTLIKKILAHSGLRSGLKESITTLTIYLLWLFGILISLSIIGVNTTSLTVVFGALGIGLGFGLQNIFNNFISGIILLFERPIQVGDAVEINGIWGEVRKINVRSTLVQTYDNASLIIPNADFISSQVTNWSFRDARIRRIITVGVAYGSDTEAVRQTLLEIAEKQFTVLKYPGPSVLFTDFGDSALIFKLRFWTDVDNCLIAESDIRFEIDRLFRKRNIQIPFPQRDIHIRSEENKGE